MLENILYIVLFQDIESFNCLSKKKKFQLSFLDVGTQKCVLLIFFFL